MVEAVVVRNQVDGERGSSNIHEVTKQTRTRNGVSSVLDTWLSVEYFVGRQRHCLVFDPWSVFTYLTPSDTQSYQKDPRSCQSDRRRFLDAFLAGEEAMPFATQPVLPFTVYNIWRMKFRGKASAKSPPNAHHTYLLLVDSPFSQVNNLNVHLNEGRKDVVRLPGRSLVLECTHP